MAQSIQEKKLFNFNNIKSAVIAAFIIGGAWARLEYKLNENNQSVLKKIDEHILADGFEKTIISSSIDVLRADLNNLRAEVKIISREFLRPTEPEIENKKR